MKSAPHLINNEPRTSTKVRRAQPQPSDDFVSAAETRALLASSLKVRQERLDAGDMVSTEEAAQMTGTSRVTMNAWIASGRAIGLTRPKRGFRVPIWQFDEPTWSVMPALSKALGTTQGWAILTFLETPHEGLDGSTPRQAIERGQQDRVLALARAS